MGSGKSSSSNGEPSIGLLWDTFTGYQRTAVLKAAIELICLHSRRRRGDRIPGGADRWARRAASRAAQSPGGRWIPTREGERYGLGPTAAAFLDRNSTVYIGAAIEFIASPMVVDGFNRLTEAVRRGGTAVPNHGAGPRAPDVGRFPRAMTGIAGMSAMLLANLLDAEHAPVEGARHRGCHGFGITLSAQSTRAGYRAGLGQRAGGRQPARAGGRRLGTFPSLAGSAFGAIRRWLRRRSAPNFLHHFDAPTCEQALAKARAALPRGDAWSSWSSFSTNARPPEAALLGGHAGGTTAATPTCPPNTRPCSNTPDSDPPPCTSCNRRRTG